MDRPFCGLEPIRLKEAHALLGAVKHHSRNALAHNMRALILSDSMCVVLAVSKGRAAELLISGISLRVRWIPSEWNTSDQGSRVVEGLRPDD